MLSHRSLTTLPITIDTLGKVFITQGELLREERKNIDP